MCGYHNGQQKYRIFLPLVSEQLSGICFTSLQEILLGGALDPKEGTHLYTSQTASHFIELRKQISL